MRRAEARAAGCLALVLLFASGCAHYLVNPPLARVGAKPGYRFSGDDTSDELFVVLAFSGGGTRAAALSYGVLQQLEKTEIYWHGKLTSLLSEVDVISSVSGGSFTAAYYALFPDRIFADYERIFLKQNIQGRLLWNLFNPRNFLRLPSPYFDRIDMAAEIYDRDLFAHKTFADIARGPGRPYFILNATDMTLGSRFEFTQDQFDPICSDLSAVPVARAVAASSAFPGLLSPLTVKSYAGSCQFERPAWYANALEDKETNARRYAEAVTLADYDGPGKPFVHLMDGGVSDNIGLRGPIRALTSTDSPWGLNDINNKKIRKLVVITVNAATASTVDWDRSERSPGILNSLKTAASTPMDHYSFETVQRLTDEIAQREQDNRTFAAFEKATGKKLPKMPEVDYYAAEINFDNLVDPAQRAFFHNLPTTFSLPKATVDCLEGVGGALLVNADGFTRLLNDLDAEARAAGVQPPPRAPAPSFKFPCG